MYWDTFYLKMSSKFANILLIFCLSMNVQIGWSSYECVNCHNVSYGTCEIEDEPGFSCGVYKMVSVRSEEAEDAADYAHPETTKDLDVCIPKGLNVTGRLGDVHPVCCVWSKELGCQLLTEISNDWWDCGTCHRKIHLSYSELQSCPCKQKKSTESSAGSKEVSCLASHFVIQTYLLYNYII